MVAAAVRSRPVAQLRPVKKRTFVLACSRRPFSGTPNDIDEVAFHVRHAWLLLCRLIACLRRKPQTRRRRDLSTMHDVARRRLEGILNGALALEEKFDDIESELAAGVRPCSLPYHLPAGPDHHV